MYTMVKMQNIRDKEKLLRVDKEKGRTTRKEQQFA